MKYLVAKFDIEAKDSKTMETACDLLCDLLGQVGFEAFEETEEGLDAYILEESFDKKSMDILQEFCLSGVVWSYKVENVEDKDWNETWEQAGFDPIIIGDKCIIYDAKHPIPDTLHPQVNVGIDARLAFGTGNHETTRMVISALFDMEVEGRRVLDCGCGTGILGIVASLLGAKEVIGYDIDEWSVENTRHNATINHVGNIEVFHGDARVLSHVSGVFDIVLANINRNVLVADMHHFHDVMAPKACLILSGFYSEDIPILLEEAKKEGLECLSQATDNNWASLVLTA
ncbi:MAG: 50S ribosomal protein L11 methyltransferase [Prevotella sp.]|nr:50S ribosomal protein L11 methyltransferase [Prevotella sp.]